MNSQNEKGESTMKWTKADKALIGQKAVYHGPMDRVIKITGVTDDLRYYWSGDKIYPSFLVEPIKSNEEKAR